MCVVSSAVSGSAENHERERKREEAGDAGQVEIDVSVVQAVEENGDRAATDKHTQQAARKEEREGLTGEEKVVFALYVCCFILLFFRAPCSSSPFLRCYLIFCCCC